MLVDSSRTASWGSPFKVRTFAGPCFSVSSDVNLSQRDTNLIQLLFVLFSDINGGDLFQLRIVTCGEDFNQGTAGCSSATMKCCKIRNENKKYTIVP